MSPFDSVAVSIYHLLCCISWRTVGEHEGKDLCVWMDGCLIYVGIYLCTFWRLQDGWGKTLSAYGTQDGRGAMAVVDAFLAWGAHSEVGPGGLDVRSLLVTTSIRVCYFLPPGSGATIQLYIKYVRELEC